MTPVPGSNDGTHSVWADRAARRAAQGVAPTATGRAGPLFSAKAVPGPPRSVVLAAVSTPGGAAGSYAATSLNAEGSWSVNQGDFSYNYPIPVPPALGGNAPDVTLSRTPRSRSTGKRRRRTRRARRSATAGRTRRGSSSSRTSRARRTRRRPAAEAGDECWDGYNATLSLGGQFRRPDRLGTGDLAPAERRRHQGPAADRRAERDVERRVLAGHDHRRDEVLLRCRSRARESESSSLTTELGVERAGVLPGQHRSVQQLVERHRRRGRRCRTGGTWTTSSTRTTT